MDVMKILAGILLILTLGLGVLLAQVVGERNVAQTSLDNKTEQLDEAKDQLEEKKSEVSNCLGSLELQRKSVLAAQAQAEWDRIASQDRAETVLTTLPSQIEKDRTYKSLADTNRWIKELVQ